MKVPFSRPVTGRGELSAIRRVVRSGWLTTGSEAAAFEAEMAAYVGARHALAVSSATAGLHLALAAMGIGSGDAVLVSPYTFVASAEVIHYLGARPVFVDIERSSYNLDPDRLEEACRRAEATGLRPAAVMPVHVAGLPCRMSAILDFARRRDMRVLEDAAHAFPVRTPDGFVGALGDAGVFSFYATKPITTGEGGMIITDRDDIAEKARVLRLHGIDRDVWRRYRDPGAAWRYDVVADGFKYNMPDTAAALGRVQLKRAGDLTRRRRDAAEEYSRAFAACGLWGAEAGLRLRAPGPGSEAETGAGGGGAGGGGAGFDHAWHLYIVEIDPELVEGGRDGVHADLAEAGIGTSVHFIPLHTFTHYRRTYDYQDGDFPLSFEAFRRVLSLPLYASMTRRQVRYVVSALASSLEKRRRARRS